MVGEERARRNAEQLEEAGGSARSAEALELWSKAVALELKDRPLTPAQRGELGPAPSECEAVSAAALGILLN